MNTPLATDQTRSTGTSLAGSPARYSPSTLTSMLSPGWKRRCGLFSSVPPPMDIARRIRLGTKSSTRKLVVPNSLDSSPGSRRDTL